MSAGLDRWLEGDEPANGNAPRLAAPAGPLDAWLAEDPALPLERSLSAAQRTTPDRGARVARAAAAAGLDPGLVDRNLEEVERRLGIGQADAQDLIERAPRLSTWLQDPVNAAAVSDDLEHMSTLEWAFRAPWRALNTGAARVQLGMLRVAQLWGLAGPEWNRQAEELSASLYRGRYGAGNFLTRSVTGTAEQIPQLMFNMTARAGGGLLGAGAAALAGQAGPQVGAPEELVTVPTAAAIGQDAGGMFAAAAVEAGLAYDELLAERDANGLPLDPKVAARTATVVGLINGTLEMAGLSTYIGFLPGGKYLKGQLAKKLAIGGAREAGRLTARETVERFAGNVAKATVAEMVTEGAQESVSAGGEKLAKDATPQPFTPVTWQDVLARGVEGAVRAGESTWLLAGVGGAPGAIEETRSALAAEYANRVMDTAADAVRRAKTPERAPEIAAQIAAEVTRATYEREILTDLRGWDEYWNGLGEDPRAKAAEVVGDDGTAYDDAAFTGGELVIPNERWLVALVRTPHHEPLWQVSKFRPDAMTAQELNEFAANLPAVAGTTPVSVSALNKAATTEPKTARPAAPPPPTAADETPGLTEIEAAVGPRPLVEDPDLAALLNDEERSSLAGLVDAARKEAEGRLTADLTRRMQREQDQIRQAARAEIRTAVEQELLRQPVYRAMAVLQSGKDPVAEVPAELRGLRLDQAAVLALRPDLAGRLKDLPFMVAGKDKSGMHPDVLAELVGFESGDQMLTALLEAPSRTKALATEVDRRLRQRMGDPRTTDEITQLALDAVHGEKRGELLMAEWRAVARQAKRDVTPVALMRQSAERYIAEKPVDTIKPHVYARAQAKAGRQFVQALARQDYDAAFDARLKQLRYHHVYRAATAARERIERNWRELEAAQKPPARAALGLAGEDFTRQAEVLLARFGIAEAPHRTGTRAPIGEWLDSLADEGLTIADLDDRIYDEDYRVQREAMTVADQQAVRDAIVHVLHLARRKNELGVGERRQALEEAKAELVAALERNLKDRGPLPADPNTEGAIEKEGRSREQRFAERRRVVTLVRWMDGEDPNGPWHRLLWNPIKDSRGEEGRLVETIATRVEAAFTKLHDAGSERLHQKVTLPVPYEGARQLTVTRGGLIAIALNTGNEGNLQRLRDGWGWTNQQIQDATDRLTAGEWDFVQEIWDTFESLRPLIAEKELARTGLEPKWVEAREVETPYGKKRGGYYPLVYDRRLSMTGEMQNAAKPGELMDTGFARPGTRRGHLKERADIVKKAPSLNLGLIPGKLVQEIHDIAFRDAILNGGRIITDDGVQKALKRHLGEGKAAQFLPMLLATGYERAYTMGNQFSAFEAWLEERRLNVAAAIIAFKIPTAAQNVTNLATALVTQRVKGRHLSAALAEFGSDPIGTAKWIREKSAELRYRMTNRDREVRDQFVQAMRSDSYLDRVRGWGYWLIGATDQMTAFPIWLARYRALLEANPDANEQDVIRAADETVNELLGAANPEDLSALMRKPGTMRWLTMFYTYMNAMENVAASELHFLERAASNGDYLAASARLARVVGLLLVLGPLSDLAVGRGPDDDEEWWEWTARRFAMAPFALLPFGRTFSSVFEAGRDYSLTPMESLGKKTERAVNDARKVAAGEGDPEKLLPHAADAVGYWVGLPVGRLYGQAEYTWDVITGNEEPESFGEFVGTALGFKPRPRR